LPVGGKATATVGSLIIEVLVGGEITATVRW
jgi:hypothetical protein